jgi:hypothetical protein
VTTGVSLSPVAPNPVTTTGTLRFSLAHAGRARLDVFDLRGRHVRSVLDGDRAAGAQSVAFDAQGLAPGVYHVRLVTDDGAASTRFVRIP